jgi:glutaredoxin
MFCNVQTVRHTDCAHAEEMARKSEVMTMPVVIKDEKKYANVVEVLDQLEKWMHEIYTAAGMCSSDPESSHETQVR